MNISKIRKVTTPKRGTSRSAGLDFYVPALDVDFVQDLYSKNINKIVPLFKDGVNQEYFIQYFMSALLIDNLDISHIKYLVGFSILPHQNIQIPSGIKINIQSVKGFDFSSHNGLMLEAANKSSISKYKHLDVGATIVDEDYQGELHLSLTNTSSSNQQILFDEKIAQFILIPIVIDDVEIVELENLFVNKTERGEGCFGSTKN